MHLKDILLRFQLFRIFRQDLIGFAYIFGSFIDELKNDEGCFEQMMNGTDEQRCQAADTGNRQDEVVL